MTEEKAERRLMWGLFALLLLTQLLALGAAQLRGPGEKEMVAQGPTPAVSPIE